jgi:hypothetical protein
MMKAELTVRITRDEIIELAKNHLEKIGITGRSIKEASAQVWPDYGETTEGETVPYWQPDTIEVRFSHFPIYDD